MSDALNDSPPGSSGRPVQWTPPTVEEIARLFPSFDSFSMIGYGGMGAVYKARQMALDRDVAIKLLLLAVSAMGKPWWLQFGLFGNHLMRSTWRRLR